MSSNATTFRSLNWKPWSRDHVCLWKSSCILHSSSRSGSCTVSLSCVNSVTVCQLNSSSHSAIVYVLLHCDWSQEKRRSKDMETITEADLLSQSVAAPSVLPRPRDEGTADLTSSLLQLLRDHSTRRSSGCQGDDIEIVGNENNPFLGKSHIMIRSLVIIVITYLSALSC